MDDLEYVVPILLGLVLVLVIIAASENATIGSLNHQVSHLQGNLNLTREALNKSVRMQENLLRNYTKTQTALTAPDINKSIIIWTIPEKLPLKGQSYWFLLDMFVNHIDVSTNGTSNYLILDLGGFRNATRGLPFVPLVI